MKEIGSFFNMTSQTARKIDKYVFMENDTQYLSCARDAIKLIINYAEEHNYEKKCILPAYTCGVVLEPFINKGWKVFFYHLSYDLKIHNEEILSLLKYNPSIIILQTYYGFDTLEKCFDIYPIIQKNKCIIVEDLTQSIFVERKKSGADVLIGSIRKWFPIPEGAFITTKLNIKLNDIKYNNIFLEYQMKAMLLKDEFLRTQDYLIKDQFRFLNKKAEEELNNKNGIRTIHPYTLQILSTLDLENIKKIRNRNYQILYDTIDNAGVGKVFDNFESDIFPYYFPIYTKKRNRVQTELAQKGIYATVFWEKHPALLGKLNHIEEDIYDCLLGFPVDQRYSEEDMYYIANAINALDIESEWGGL